jgi:hypothetical protein
VALSKFANVSAEGPDGQVTFETANLGPKATGLPFVVWVSQKAGAPHDIRVKVAQTVKVSPSQMSVYGVRPFTHLDGPGLGSGDEKLLANWLVRNQAVLVAFWDGDIEFTEDLTEKITSSKPNATSQNWSQ